MRKLFLWLVALLSVAACTRQTAPLGALNFSKYTVDGRSSRTTARAYLEASKNDGTARIFIKAGIPPVGLRQEVLYLYYIRSAGSATPAYKASFLTFNYSDDSVVHAINYNTNLHGTLKQTPAGGYSGTLRGTCPSSATHKKSMVRVVFKNVMPTPPRKQ